MARPTILVVNLYDPVTGLVVPFITQRILEYTSQHCPEIDALEYTRGVMRRLVVGDPDLRVLALVENGKLMGHAVAQYQSDGTNKWVLVAQCHTDPGNWGDIIDRVIDDLDTWAEKQGVKTMLWSSHKRDKNFIKRRGMKDVRHIMTRAVGSPPTKDVTTVVVSD